MRLNKGPRCKRPPVSLWKRFWQADAVHNVYESDDACPRCGRLTKDHQKF